jgi:uncharacterized membrane protein SpoIIM required for sporulation
MNQQQFEQKYHQAWSEFEDWLEWRENRQEKSAGSTVNPIDIPQRYRQLCHHLSLARERRYASILVERLHDLVLRGHQILYSSRSSWLAGLTRFLVFEFPAAVRSEARLFWLAAILFYGAGLFMYLAVLNAPDMVYTMMDPETANSIESMYNPENDKFGRERGSESDMAMFGHYIRNNISIAFQTFAGGLLFTLGSFFFLLFNGLFFGAVTAHLTHAGYTETFYSFVVGHGSFELTAIVISGAAGIRLGLALLMPGRRSRGNALRHAARISGKLVGGAAVMLVFAAFIEAFWSSTHFIPPMIKYFIGASLWIAVAAYLLLAGRRYAA